MISYMSGCGPQFNPHSFGHCISFQDAGWSYFIQLTEKPSLSSLQRIIKKQSKCRYSNLIHLLSHFTCAVLLHYAALFILCCCDHMIVVFECHLFIVQHARCCHIAFSLTLFISLYCVCVRVREVLFIWRETLICDTSSPPTGQRAEAGGTRRWDDFHSHFDSVSVFLRCRNNEWTNVNFCVLTRAPWSICGVW